MSHQLEFDFDYASDIPQIKSVNIPINIPTEVEIDDDFDNWYRTSKWGDKILDTLPYGWRLYYRYQDVKQWFITKYQQWRYGVADSECWSLDSTFTRFILPRLKHFKKMTRHTYPSDGITPERWEEILDEIIWTFEYMNDDEKMLTMPCCDDNGDFKGYLNRERTEKEKLEWKNYFDQAKAFNRRKKEGLKLFAQYYEVLWD